MLFWILLALSSIPLAFVAWALYLVVLYRKTPELAWKYEVLRRHEAALAELRKLNRAREELKSKLQQDWTTLKAQFFEQFLATIPTAELDAFSGIGPGTVAKLREHGFKNLAQLKGASIAIPGLGEKRLTDINQAAQNLLAQANERFENSKCRPAQEYVAALAQKKRAFEFDKDRLERDLRAWNALVGELLPFVSAARNVTFADFLDMKAGKKKELVPERLLTSAIPALKTVPRADEKGPASSVYRVDAPQVEVIRPASAKPASDFLRESKTKAPAMADAAPTRAKRKPAAEPDKDDDQTPNLLDTTIEFVCMVARYDRRITKKEEAWIERNIVNTLKDDKGQFNRAKALFAHFKTAAVDVDRCLAAVKSRNRKYKESLLTVAVGLMHIDGPIHEANEKFLHRVAKALDMPLPKSEFDTAPEAAISTPAASEPVNIKTTILDEDQSLKTLEIDPAMPLTADLIRRNYFRLREKFLPDKVASMGPEFVAIAERKSQDVKDAALLLMAPFKEELEPVKVAAPPQDLRHNPDLDSLFGA